MSVPDATGYSEQPETIGVPDLVGLAPLPKGFNSVSYVRALRDADDPEKFNGMNGVCVE